MTYEQKNVIFQLSQFINRDKGRIGITENVRRRTNASQLGREDIRTKDRLRVLIPGEAAHQNEMMSPVVTE